MTAAASKTPSYDYPAGAELPSLAGIEQAHARIRDHIHLTPLQTSSTLNARATAALGGLMTPDGRKVRLEIALKMESLQRIGAFKIRGGLNATLRYLSDSAPEGPLTIITHSSGNHAQAIALTAKLLSTPERPITATIIMPSSGSKVKKAAVIGYGAKVIECAPDTRARQATCDAEMEKIRAERGLVHFISPYDHIDVLQGQGTTIVECARQIGAVWGSDVEPDIVIAPAGGGGLMSGVSVASKGYWKDCKVVAAEPAGANDLHRTFYSATDRSQAVWHAAINPTTSLCDGLLTATGRMTMPTILRNVDAVLLAEDKATIRAMKLVWQRMKLIIEPSCALALAVMLEPTAPAAADAQPSAEPWVDLVKEVVASRVARESDRVKAAAAASQIDELVVRVVVVITGGNVEFAKVLGWFAEAEADEERATQAAAAP